MIHEPFTPPCASETDRRCTFLRALTVGVVGLALAGCGRRDLHPASGRVRFPDGAPLTAGRVVLDYGPGSVRGGWGYIQPDGTFTLGSFTGKDGVRSGTVRVAITFAYAKEGAPGTEGRSGSQPEPLVHPRFESPETSGLSFEIPRQTEWDIVVERP